MRADVDLAWLAGVFEGEGAIRINTPTRPNKGGFLSCAISNTDVEMLTPFHERWGGHFTEVSTKPQHSDAWRWQVVSRMAQTFLTDLLPYLRTAKYREKAELGLRFQAQKRPGRPRDGGEYLARQLDFHAEMRALNAARRRVPIAADFKRDAA